MPIENWSDSVVVAHLADDPQFTDDLESVTGPVKNKKASAVLDFAAVHYINSSNIARLLKLRKQIIGNEARLMLCNLSTQVWSVFLITGLDKIFEFSDNVPTALATIQMRL